MLQNNIDKINTHKNEGLEVPDEKLEELKAKMLLSKTPDTMEKFGKILNAHSKSRNIYGWFIPQDPKEFEKNSLDFEKNLNSWKYKLGLYIFLIVFLFLLAYLASSGFNVSK